MWIYAILLVANPFLHHDLDCHLKSPTHCTACSSSPFAGRTEGEVCLATWTLPEAGRIEWRACPAVDAGTVLETTGRSPPA